MSGAGKAVAAAKRDRTDAPASELPAPRATAASGRIGTKKATAADQGRIAELKAKLGDEAYMAGAILRIATVLSARLTEGYVHGGRTTRRQTRMDGAK